MNTNGDNVMIYEDSLTELKPEGNAVLIKMLFDNPEQEYWVVRFVSSDDWRATHHRWIKK